MLLVGWAALAGWLCVLRGVSVCVCLWRVCAAGDVGCGGNVENDAILYFRSIRFALLQAAGFGDGEAFTEETFTGDWSFELEEMEVFAVSGYP